MKQSKKSTPKNKVKAAASNKPAKKTPKTKIIAAKPTKKSPVKPDAKARIPATKAANPAASAPREITTEIISARAFTLWDQAGRPLGRDLEYWLAAESQLKQETQALAA